MFKCSQLDSMLISEISALSSFTVKYIEKKFSRVSLTSRKRFYEVRLILHKNLWKNNVFFVVFLNLSLSVDSYVDFL